MLKLEQSLWLVKKKVAEGEITEASRIKYDFEKHGGLQKHGYKRDTDWTPKFYSDPASSAANSQTRMYRHPNGSKTLCHGGGLGNDFHWTHWDKKFNEKSGNTAARLSKHLGKIHGEK